MGQAESFEQIRSHDNGSLPIAAPHHDSVETECLHAVAEIAGAKIQYTREQPTDHDLIQDEVPLLITHGYGGVERAYDGLRGQIAQTGKPAITYRPARSMGVTGDLDPRHLLRPGELSSKAAWGVMRDTRDNLGYELFDTAGHSMGGPTAVGVALHKPEHTRSIILMASAGVGEQSTARMIGNSLTFLHSEMMPFVPAAIKKSKGLIAFESLHYVFRNFGRTIAEGLYSASCDIQEAIDLLRENRKSTGGIIFRSDSFFPLDEVVEQTRSLFDAHHIYDTEDSNHLTPQTDPAGVAKAVHKMLQELHADLDASEDLADAA